MKNKTSSQDYKFRQGSIMTGPFWPEQVKVLTVKQIGNKVSFEVVGVNTRNYYTTLLSSDDLSKIETDTSQDAAKYKASAKHFRLVVEANRIRLAYEYDPHFAISVSQIDPLPHQIEAVYHYMLRHPKVRFLLADDPGAGKTIMAGLLIKELKYRGLIERTLIVTPANLTDQWRRELKDKFNEVFQVVNRSSMETLYGKNVWEDRNQCLTSVDFAKQEEVVDSLRDARWDLIIVDEAHKMAAYKYGNKVKKSERYKLGELLSKQTDHLVFLTATPHKGDPENFTLFLQLLEKDLFSDKKIVEDAVRAKENPIFLRRLKEDLTDFEGKPIFPPRKVKTIRYELSPREKELYDAVTDYVRNYFQIIAGKDDKASRNVGFALIVLQRRLASSLRAIRKSLERRKQKLEELKSLGLRFAEEGIPDFEGIEDLEESERWKIEQEAIERFTTAKSIEELQQEIDQLTELIRLARLAEKEGTEKKLEELRQVIKNEKLGSSKEKLLIFTEAKDTLEYLEEKLQSWGFNTVVIHGNMKLGDSRNLVEGTRLWAEHEFNKKDEKQVLIATEAAGEGINLQERCRLMVNYDIPWNPNRLEQRMGRIHRYGQRYEVHIHNLVATDTIEGRVLGKLFDKLENMRKHLGSDRVFDVIGELFEGVGLEQLFKDALANKISLDDLYDVVDNRLAEENLRKVKGATLEALATRHIDMSRLLLEREQARQQRLMPEYIERFFVEAFEELGGTIEKRKDGFWRIKKVPAKVRHTKSKFVQIFGYIANEYPKLTFLKEEAKRHEDAEFIAQGHPLFEAVVDQIFELFSSSLTQGAAFFNADSSRKETLWFIKAGVQDGLGRVVGKRLFALITERDTFELKNPSYLLDCKPSQIKDLLSLELVASPKDEDEVVFQSLGLVINDYFEEIKQERTHELEVKEKYLKKSFNHLILETMDKIIDYQRQQMTGKDVARFLKPLEQHKEDLVERRDKTLVQMERERNLTLATPEVVGSSLIFPISEIETSLRDTMHRDDEVEAIAMAMSTRYEKQNGRDPEDVGSQNLGFDIRSKYQDNKFRYIEVKGRAGVGSIALTPNEWIKAHRLGQDFWLYIVVNAKSATSLYILQNPAIYLKPNEQIDVVRYIVAKNQWQKMAKEVKVKL